MITLSTADQFIIAAYFLAVLLIGFLSGRGSRGDSVDFLLAGRSLTLPVFVMTLVSTWYGGILGVGEFSYRYGISNWVVQGIPYYVFAAVFAVLLAEKIRATNLMTIPDKLHQSYDKRTALLGSLLTFILMTPAPYVLMLAILLQMVTGWGIASCILVGTIATTAYLYLGGFRSDVNTDVFEFFLMFAGIAVILPFAYMKFGGLEFIRAHVPPLHLTWNGGNSIQFVLVWFFIALWTLVDPAFHQRCYAAKSGKVARNGIFISIGFWFLFDAMTATAGLYARAALPDLAQPVMAFPMLAEVTLPSFAKGLFYVGMLATIMSTLNTLAFVSATTIGRDIVWRFREEKTEERVNLYTQWGLVSAGALSIVLALFVPSVIKLWYAIGTVVIPGLLVVLVTSYFDRWKVGAGFAFYSMLFGWLTSLVWLLVGWRQELGNADSYPLGIEPMYPGLLVAIMIWIAGWFMKQAPVLPFKSRDRTMRPHS
jgi:solute:Na+ symporter, SSS family